jgi:hypothetical protein
MEMAAHSNGLHGLYGLYVSASHIQFIQLMQIALTIAVLVLATYYVVKRFFLRKKSSSCQECNKS